MGQSADQLREEIDQKRDDASRKIDEIESRIESTTENVRDEVKQTAQDLTDQVKETLDVKSQIEERPLVAIGVGLVGGFLLGGMGGDGGSHSSRRGSSMQAGVMKSLRDTAKETGLNDTLAAAASALMGVATTQAKGMASDRVSEMKSGSKKENTKKQPAKRTVVEEETVVVANDRTARIR